MNRLIVATLLSSLAGGIFMGALPLAVASGGGGPLAVGLVSAALTAWWALSVPMSAAVDRYGVGRSLRAAAPMRILALLLIAATGDVTGIFAGALLYGMADCVASTAFAALPALVIDRDRYDQAFARLFIAGRVAGLVIGPSAGAALLVTARWLPFVVAGVALVLAYAAAVPYFGIRCADSGTRVAAGLRHLWGDGFLRPVAVTLVGVVIAEELVAVAVVPYVRDGSGLAGWEQALGFMRAGAGIAAIMAAMGAAALARRFSRLRVLSVVALGGALAPAVLAIGPWWAPVLTALLVAAVAEAVWVPLVQAETARRTPANLIARTRAAMMLLTWGTLPVTGVMGGALAESVGIRPMLLLASVAAAVSCVTGVWRLQRSAPASD